MVATICSPSVTAPSRSGRWSSSENISCRHEQGIPCMSQEIAGSARSKFGTWSLIVAAIAFSIGIVSLAVYLGLPDDSSDFAKSTATWTFIAGFIGLAPLLHVIGF